VEDHHLQSARKEVATVVTLHGSELVALCLE
jgi:hypothetical protein